MRISTTTLESYRLFMQPDQEWMTEQALQATIRGEFTPTPKMLLGSAYGAVLESPYECKVAGGYRSGDYFFRDAVVEPALAVFDRRGVFEAKATKRYGTCDVVARADQLIGARLIENKTTLATFDAQKYLDSYQWRFMADIFEPVSVTYHVFCLSESHAGDVELRGIETFNVYPYPGLHVDCCALLQGFIEYVTARGLDVFLRERQQLAEVPHDDTTATMGIGPHSGTSAEAVASGP